MQKNKENIFFENEFGNHGTQLSFSSETSIIKDDPFCSHSGFAWPYSTHAFRRPLSTDEN